MNWKHNNVLGQGRVSAQILSYFLRTTPDEASSQHKNMIPPRKWKAITPHALRKRLLLGRPWIGKLMALSLWLIAISLEQWIFFRRKSINDKNKTIFTVRILPNMTHILNEVYSAPKAKPVDSKCMVQPPNHISATQNTTLWNNKYCPLQKWDTPIKKLIWNRIWNNHNQVLSICIMWVELRCPSRGTNTNRPLFSSWTFSF